MPKFNINGKELHYLDIGEGDTILFGHSFLFDCHSWDSQIELLSKHYRCIVPDLWGHGLSASISQDNYSIEQIADDYWDLTQALGIEQFSIIGISVGGMWATEMTLKHPESITSLVLMDTYVGAEEKPAMEQYLAMLNAVEKAQQVPEPIIKAVIPMFFSSKTIADKNNPLVNDLAGSLEKIDSKSASTIALMGRTIFTRRSLLDQLDQISCPTLLIVGNEDVPRPVTESEEMAELIKNSVLEIIGSAGHMSNLEQAEKVNQLLENFFLK